jgi:hypothetical protein
MDAALWGSVFASDCLRTRMGLFGHSDIRTFGHSDMHGVGRPARTFHIAL